MQGATIRCDGCRKTIPIEGSIWNCPGEDRRTEHPYGYDVCDVCASTGLTFGRKKQVLSSLSPPLPSLSLQTNLKKQTKGKREFIIPPIAPYLSEINRFQSDILKREDWESKKNRRESTRFIDELPRI